MIAMALRRGAKSKIGEARFGKCHLTITPPEFIKGVREGRIFRKKNGGRGPTGPPIGGKEYGTVITVMQMCKKTKGVTCTSKHIVGKMWKQ
jgi:hypothetical protein